MPRKFLGQKILPDIDFVRPSSLTLTGAELNELPMAPWDYDQDGSVTQGHVSKNLSSKFGTLKLRRRLESVPELFLHDFKERSKKNRRMNRVETEKPCPLPYVKEQNLQSIDTDGKIDAIFVSNPIIAPLKLSNNDYKTIYMHKRSSRSTNEILFDEILESYATENIDNPPLVLKGEIDRIVENIKNKKGNIPIVPTIMDSNETESFYSRQLTPPPEPQSPQLRENISSPEYTGTSASDRWSSGDDFSDFGSIANLAYDEGYTTAPDSIGSNCETHSKKLPVRFGALSHSRSGTKKLKLIKIKFSTVNPTIMYPSDVEEMDDGEHHVLVKREENIEDLRQLSQSSLDSLSELQRKIQEIDIEMPKYCGNMQ